MLKSFIVRNFRLFDELRIENLGSVNLIVGKNNSGKSCLLEAIHIYASDANPKTLVDMAMARDEHWLSQVKKQEGQVLPESENFLRYLFHGYVFPELGKSGIEVGPISPERDRIQIVNRAYQLLDSQDGRRLRVPVDQQLLFDEVVNLQLALEIKKADKSEYLLSLPVDPTSADYRRQIVFRVREPRFSVQTVSTGSVNENQLAQLWDNINLTDLQDEVVACLQLIDSSIRDVAFVGEGRSRIAIVRKDGSQERLPLKNMGDGILRLFHIILAIANAKNGLLLIDEFENGLYWGIQPRLWETVFRISEKLNVQVFATTHSKDCVNAFQDVWAMNEERGSFHRIDYFPGKGIKCVPYSLETLADAIDMNVEVR